MRDLKERWLAANAKYEAEDAKVGELHRIAFDGGPRMPKNILDAVSKAMDELKAVETEIIELAEMAGFVIAEPLSRDRFAGVDEPQRAAA